MSRKVNRNEGLANLSKQDLIYLAERGRITVAEQNEFLGPNWRQEMSDLGPNTGDEAGVQAQDETLNEDGTESTASAELGTEEDEDDDEDSEDTDYESLSKEELKAELDERDIEYKASATKPELIELLEADDEE